MDKAPDAFRTISEVADDLKVPQHVLRFWETRFSQIKPMKRAGGRRYYRPDDVDLLRGIHHLLYGQGYTIRGVQRILRDQGLKFVQTVWHPGAEQPPQDASDADGPELEEGEGPPPQRRAAEASTAGSRGPQMSRDVLLRLQSALYELSECRRLLDQALTRNAPQPGAPAGEPG